MLTKTTYISESFSGKPRRAIYVTQINLVKPIGGVKAMFVAPLFFEKEPSLAKCCYLWPLDVDAASAFVR